jgi:hypothetical protein
MVYTLNRWYPRSYVHDVTCPEFIVSTCTLLLTTSECAAFLAGLEELKEGIQIHGYCCFGEELMRLFSIS